MWDPASQNAYAYADNNPVNQADPSGMWAFGITFGLNFSFGASVSVQVCICFDTHGNVGLVTTEGTAQSTGVGPGFTVRGLISNADTIDDLEGPFGDVGVSVGEGPAVSADLSFGHAKNGDPVQVFELGLAGQFKFPIANPVPGELHAGATATQIPFGDPNP